MSRSAPITEPHTRVGTPHAAFLSPQLPSPSKVESSWRKGNRQYSDEATDSRIAACDQVQGLRGRTKSHAPQETRAPKPRDKTKGSISFGLKRGPKSLDNASSQRKNSDSHRLHESL